MKFKRQCRSRSQDNSVKMPLRLVVILCSVFVVLVIPDLTSALPVGNLNYDNDISINPYGPPTRPNFNSLNNLYSPNRANNNGLRQAFYYPSHNYYRLEPYYTSLDQMTHPEERQQYPDRGFRTQGIKERGPIRFSKEYQEFLLPLSSNSDINPGNLAVNYNPRHPNEGGPEISTLYIDSEQDGISSGISNGPSSLPSSSPLSSQNQSSPNNLSLLGHTKRAPSPGYMCHFKLCQSPIEGTWKRLYTPSADRRNGEANRSTS